MKIQASFFADTMLPEEIIFRIISCAVHHYTYIIQITINLIGRCKYYRWLMLRITDGFQEVERALCIYLKIIERINKAGGHSYLCCKMKYLVCVVYSLCNSRT